MGRDRLCGAIPFGTFVEPGACRRLRELGKKAPTSRSAAWLAQSGDPDAVAFVREGGLLLGDVLATAVSLLNPQVLMIGGDLMRAQEHFMVAVREHLYWVAALIK